MTEKATILTPDQPGFYTPITNAETLRHEEWISWDKVLVDVARQRLNVVADLKAAGCAVPLGNIGITIANYQKSSDMTPAGVTMSGKASGEKDSLTFTDAGVPVPVHRKDFNLSKRRLEASRRGSEPLDSTGVRIAGRIVADSLESMVFNGVSGLSVDGKTIQGLTTYTYRNTHTLSAAWDDTEDEDRDILGDVEAMLAAAYADNFYGPFTLYVPKNYWAAIQADYSGVKGDKTYKERIEAYSDIASVKPGDSLSDDNVVLVQMTSDVIDLPWAQDIQNMEYASQDPMSSNFMVSAIMTVRIKSDQDGRCGVVHGTVA